MKEYFSGSYAFLKERLLKVFKKKDPLETATVIVHTNQMKKYLKEYLAQHLGILFNTEFFTLIDISKKITGIEPFSDFEKELLLKKILMGKDLSDGLSEDMGLILQQIKEYQIPVEKISSLFIKDVIHQYEILKGEKYLDREDLHKKAINSKDFYTDYLIIFGIHSVPVLHQRLFEHISSLSKNIYVFTAFINQSGVYSRHTHFSAEVRPFYEKIAGFVTFEKESCKNLSVAKSIFTDKYEKIKNENISIFSARNEREETEIVAQKIIKLVKNGTRYSQIGVVIPQISTYLTHIKQIFKKYHIPYYLTEENRYIDDFKLKKLFTLFKLKGEDLTKDRLISVLSDKIFQIENPEDIEKTLLSLPSFSGLNDLKRVFPFDKFPQFLKLLEFVNSLPEEGNIDLYTDWLKTLIKEFLKDQICRDFIKNIIETIRKNPVYKDLFGSIRYEEFLLIVNSFFQEENKEKRVYSDTVTVVDPIHAEGNNFKHIFFMNLNSGIFPQPIKNEIVSQIDYPKHILMQQLLNFVNIFDKSKKIHLSFVKSSTVSGKETKPSLFLDEVIKIVDTIVKEEKVLPVLPEDLKLLKPDKKVLDRYNIFTQSFDINRFYFEPFNRFPISATSFQKYPFCPYRFYIEEVAGFKPGVEFDRRSVDPMKKGKAVHQFLHEFYRDTDLKKVNDPELFVESVREKLYEKYTKITSDLIKEVFPPYRPIEESKLKIMFERILSFIKSDISYINASGMEVSKDLLEKSVRNDLFTGRIDRADTDRQGNIVIYDYKTGGKPPENVEKEIKIKYSQLLVYKSIIGEKVKSIGIIAVNDETRKYRYTVDSIDDTFVEQAIKQIKEGFFPPIKRNSCDFCPFTDVCPKSDDINKKLKKLEFFRDIV